MFTGVYLHKKNKEAKRVDLFLFLNVLMAKVTVVRPTGETNISTIANLL